MKFAEHLHNDALYRHGYYVNRAFGVLRMEISKALGVYIGLCARRGELYQNGSQIETIWDLRVSWMKEGQGNPAEGVPAHPAELSVTAIENALRKTSFFALEKILEASIEFFVDPQRLYRLKITSYNVA